MALPKQRDDTYRQTHLVHSSGGDQQRYEQVTKHPQTHKHGTEVAVGIVQTLAALFLRFDPRRQRSLHSRLELTVDIGLRLVDFLDEVLLVVVVLFWFARKAVPRPCPNPWYPKKPRASYRTRKPSRC